MFENYGDINFFDGGVLVEKEGNEYRVIKCDLDCDTEKYFLTENSRPCIFMKWEGRRCFMFFIKVFSVWSAKL